MNASTLPVVFHRSERIDGLKIAYREAGPKDAPVVVLLHGFPTSSHMFRHLMPYLADGYRVIAPDYPGYGQSDAPDHTKYAYTFENFGNLVRTLLERLGVQKYAMYVMDYGAPVGWQLFLKHPEKLTALIVQNGNAYDEGLKAFWDPIKTYWADGAEKSRDALRWLVKADTTIFQYTDGVDDVTRISPDNWVHDQALLDRPGNEDIQMDVMYDYRNNVPLYPEVQRLFREHQPPTLITWGERDTIFPADGAHPYKRDLKDLEFHLFPTGHFALEDKGDEIMPLIRGFLDRKIGKKA
ncbi:alpha/beta fold hydrolase [Luteibacter aegosomatis]|uniref:alpha/beta fold hydrolase n=1 Tax=Luteibacter aegosomatis TaxID=2911537 RepID=UPI002111AA45|nr:alpha/beta hydrolase [Luteibacter aegosomatis]